MQFAKEYLALQSFSNSCSYSEFSSLVAKSKVSPGTCCDGMVGRWMSSPSGGSRDLWIVWLLLLWRWWLKVQLSACSLVSPHLTASLILFFISQMSILRPKSKGTSQELYSWFNRDQDSNPSLWFVLTSRKFAFVNNPVKALLSARVRWLLSLLFL